MHAFTFRQAKGLRLLPLLAAILLLTGCLYPTDPSVLQIQEDAAPATEEPLTEIEPTDIEVEQIEEDEAAPLADVDLSQTLVRATFLIGREVENVEEQDIGVVEDFILDEETGQILYTVVEYGGFLDIGDADLAIPPAAFTWNDEAELVLAVDEADLEVLPVIDDEWPSVDIDDWDAEIDDFWIEAGFMEAELESLPVRTTDLLDLTLGDVSAVAGVLEDLLLDLDTHQARYLALQGGAGFWEPDIEILVPFEALASEIVGDERVFVVDADLDVLAAAPAMDRQLFLSVDFIDSTLVDRLDAYWEEQGLK